MEAYIFDWLNLLLRWLHVITAIAWIGSSFYFVWLDNSLTRPDDPDLLEKGVGGELWAVHGGGFYNPQKYLLAPKTLPQNLHWFFWESYSTWLSGFAEFEPVATGVVVVLLLVAFAMIVRSRIGDPHHALEPEDGLTVRNVAEIFVEGISSMAESVIGHHSQTYVPLLGSVSVSVTLVAGSGPLFFTVSV